jgi:hypothetical protein
MSDLRSNLIRLAYQQPELRKDLLPLLRQAMEFDSKEALSKYLSEHPKADKSNHSVKKSDRGHKSVALPSVVSDVEDHLGNVFQRERPQVWVDDTFHGNGYSVLTVQMDRTYKKDKLTADEKRYQKEMERKILESVKTSLGGSAEDFDIAVNTDDTGFKVTNNIQVTLSPKKGTTPQEAEKPKAEKPKAEKPKAEKPKAEKPKAEYEIPDFGKKTQKAIDTYKLSKEDLLLLRKLKDDRFQGRNLKDSDHRALAEYAGRVLPETKDMRPQDVMMIVNALG